MPRANPSTGLRRTPFDCFWILTKIQIILLKQQKTDIQHTRLPSAQMTIPQRCSPSIPSLAAGSIKTDMFMWCVVGGFTQSRCIKTSILDEIIPPLSLSLSLSPVRPSSSPATSGLFFRWISTRPIVPPAPDTWQTEGVSLTVLMGARYPHRRWVYCSEKKGSACTHTCPGIHKALPLRHSNELAAQIKF